jgi:hypothetical protein
MTLGRPSCWHSIPRSVTLYNIFLTSHWYACMTICASCINVIGKRAATATEPPPKIGRSRNRSYFQPLKHDYITKSSYSCAADIAIAYGLEYGSHCSAGGPVEGVVLHLLPAL